jgi:hypothetical protein
MPTLQAETIEIGNEKTATLVETGEEAANGSGTAIVDHPDVMADEKSQRSEGAEEIEILSTIGAAAAVRGAKTLGLDQAVISGEAQLRLPRSANQLQI